MVETPLKSMYDLAGKRNSRRRHRLCRSLYAKMGSLCSNYAYRLVNLLENRRKMVETALENGIRPV